MIRGYRLLGLLAAGILLCAGALWAGQGFDGLDRVSLDADCQIGNLNDPVGEPVPGIFTGEESYAYHVFPPEQCGCTEGGFTVESVSQLLYFDQTQVPTILHVEARLLTAIEDPTTGCWLPGQEACIGPVVDIPILEPGYHLVNAPVLGCPMQVFNEHYFISLRYMGGAMAYLPIDDQPQPCTEYVDRGAGWEDLFNFGKTGGGKSIIFGDIVCGALSVDAEIDSWGSIKSLYR